MNDPLYKIKAAGFSVSLVDGFIDVKPTRQPLTDDQRAYIKKHKNEIIAALQTELPVIKCRDCLHYKCHNAHGKGAGYCLVSGDYGSWSETPHTCEKFNAAVELVDLPEPKPGALIVKCFTPNGQAFDVEARDAEHVEWLKRMNPKLGESK